jgi:HSP20 family protein
MQLTEALGLDPFFAEFDRLAQRLLEPAPTAGRWNGLSLPTDIVRRGDHVIVTMELPGPDWQDVDVHVEGRVLTVSAERKPDTRDGDVVYLRGRAYGRVRQQFTMPDGLDTEAITATYEHGVLTVSIPLAQAARPRRIEVGGLPPRKQIET